MLLKAILTDGHYTTEDFLMVGCLPQRPTPTPTPSVTPGIFPTPTPTSFMSVTPTPSSNSLLVLNAANNWTYRFNDFLIIRYIPVNSSDTNAFITIPALESVLLPQIGQPSPIPLSASINRGTTKIGDLLFINGYLNRSIVLNTNNTSYQSSINIGQIVF